MSEASQKKFRKLCVHLSGLGVENLFNAEIAEFYAERFYNAHNKLPQLLTN